jgi:hypothetical protein
MRITTSNGLYEIKNPVTNSPILLQVQLGAQGLWSNPIDFIYDSGDTTESFALIPQTLLDELELNLPKIGKEKSELADGGEMEGKLSLLNMRFNSIPSNQSVIIEDLVVTISDSASAPLINFGSYFNVFIKEGKLVILELNGKALVG